MVSEHSLELCNLRLKDLTDLGELVGNPDASVDEGLHDLLGLDRNDGPVLLERDIEPVPQSEGLGVVCVDLDGRSPDLHENHSSFDSAGASSALA